MIVDSAGTQPGSGLNPLSVETLREVGVDISDQAPQALTAGLIAAADLVIVLGHEAQVETVGGHPVTTWDTDEPSLRGITGIERMRLIRDDITRRVDDLIRQFARSAERGGGDSVVR